jgi:hypothetical protein
MGVGAVYRLAAPACPAYLAIRALSNLVCICVSVALIDYACGSRDGAVVYKFYLGLVLHGADSLPSCSGLTAQETVCMYVLTSLLGVTEEGRFH